MLARAMLAKAMPVKAVVGVVIIVVIVLFGPHGGAQGRPVDGCQKATHKRRQNFTRAFEPENHPYGLSLLARHLGPHGAHILR